jgi:parallel beta-helix repeat protein
MLNNHLSNNYILNYRQFFNTDYICRKSYSYGHNIYNTKKSNLIVKIFNSFSHPSPILILFSLLPLFCICLSTLVIQSVIAASINETNVDTVLQINNHDKRIAFVEPTFTYAAYRNGSFYNFYDKYSPQIQHSSNLSVTNDLNLIKNRPIPHEPFFYFINPTYTTIPYKGYFDILYQHAKKNSSMIANISDTDIHQGKIFQADGSNAYDILFLFHNEYVTQSEYNNLKRFVSNGGTIVFNQSNSLFAEVSYNNFNDSITLVDGHFWKFDGKTAKNSTGERWLNENKEWVGSNFLDVSSKLNVYFRNNPFNYTHVEEQYVTNPKANILVNFHAYSLPDKYANATVAIYEMNYGKGKSINLGIWGPTLANNTKFLNYYDNVILPIALNESSVLNQTLFSNYAKSSSTEPEKCANYDSDSNVITVFCNTNLSGINSAIHDKTVLKKDPNGVWILNATMLVNPMAKLTINQSDTSWLKIMSKNESEPNFIKIIGSTNIDGVKITSWNPVSKNSIIQNTNGSIPRPFILFDNSTGNVNISNSEMAFLGYNAYPSDGFVFRGGGNGSSTITNNIMHDMWDGFYSDSAKYITIKNNQFYNNLRHGLNVDAGSHDLNIIGNTASNNNNTGMLCSDRCHNVLFDNNTVHNNGETGFMFSSGTYNSTAKKNYAYNEKTGISIISSLNDKIYDNLLKSNDRGIFIGENSTGSHIYNNTLMNDKTGIQFDNPPESNALKNNSLYNVSTPVYLNS